MIARLRDRWARLSTGGRLAAVTPVLALIVVVVVAASGVLTTPPVTSVASPTPPPAPTPSPSPEPSPTFQTPAATPEPPGADPLLGVDGRFTILLLGSDYRGSSPGNRTDTIMIVSVVPDSGAVTVVSIPRDTARFPLPDGRVWRSKLNALYPSLTRKFGSEGAGTELRRLIGGTLGLEIDAYALIGLVGLTELVDAIGGVDVFLEEAYHDPYYWTNQGTQGVSFAAGRNHLNGDRALIFARTRKGDSDFQRVRRQQQLVEAVAVKVLKRGAEALPALVKLVSKWVITDVTIDKAAAIYALVAKADLEKARTEVFGPRYADKIPGSVDYQLRLDKVHAFIARWFAPVPGSPAAPSASGSPAP